MKQIGLILCTLGVGLLSMSVQTTMAQQTAVSAAANAKTITVKGVIKDSTGPMMGVAVRVAGTTNGAISDMDGNFSISCNEGDDLEVSFVGYKNQSLKAQPNMTIVMEEDNKIM